MFGKTSWVLKGIRGPHAHAVFVLERSVIIGRSANADIQVLDQRVSRQHARLLVLEDEVILEDLGSHNGSHVHGHQVHRRPLRPGDKIQFGVAEYALDQVKGRVITSAIFLNKLTNRETMGATAVKRRLSKEILTSPTADMPVQRETRELGATSSQTPSEQSRPLQPDPSPDAATEPNYLRDQRARAIRLPTPTPGELEWSAQKSSPAPRAAPPPKAQPVVPIQSPAIEAATLPLDPRTQRMHTPVPEGSTVTAPQPVPPVEPAQPSEPARDAKLEAALRTIDAVVHLLKLRSEESGGGMLRIQDRESLRRLEGALRESRRNKANRRRWIRLPCHLSAELGESHQEASVTDIGAGGLRIGSPSARVSPGDTLMVRVLLGDDRLARVVVFHTKVAWVDTANGAFGATFAGPAQWELAG